MAIAPVGPGRRPKKEPSISVPAPTAAPPLNLEEMAPPPAAPVPAVITAGAVKEPPPGADQIGLPVLRNIRAEIQDLQAILTQIRNGEVTLPAAAAYIQKSRADIDALFQNLSGDDSSNGDTIRHIRNYWEQIGVLPAITAPESEQPTEQLIPGLNAFEALNRQMVFQIASITVPCRLDDWLENSDPGYYIPFHMVFADEIPNLDDRTRLLNFLACTPRVLKYGIIDASSGLVYRIALNARDWFVKLAIILVSLLAGFGVVAGSAYLPVSDWPIKPTNLGLLLAGFASVLVGIAVHYLIAKTKSRQEEGDLPPVIALGDIKRLLSAKAGSMLIKIVMALVGLFGLIFVGGITQLSVLNAFLMGYSLDSFIGLFSTSIEERSSAQLTALKEATQQR